MADGVFFLKEKRFKYLASIEAFLLNDETERCAKMSQTQKKNCCQFLNLKTLSVINTHTWHCNCFLLKMGHLYSCLDLKFMKCRIYS